MQFYHIAWCARIFILPITCRKCHVLTLDFFQFLHLLNWPFVPLFLISAWLLLTPLPISPLLQYAYLRRDGPCCHTVFSHGVFTHKIWIIIIIYGKPFHWYTFLCANWNLMYTTKQNSRVSFLYLRRHSAGVGWAGIAKGKTWWYFVDSTPRSQVPESLNLLALQLKPSLSGLRTPEDPLFSCLVRFHYF